MEENTIPDCFGRQRSGIRLNCDRCSYNNKCKLKRKGIIEKVDFEIGLACNVPGYVAVCEVRWMVTLSDNAIYVLKQGFPST